MNDGQLIWRSSTI